MLATQNPIEQEGTYPLPEAQLDRFLLHVRVDYPAETEEQAILVQHDGRPCAQQRRRHARRRGDRAAASSRARCTCGDDVLRWITRLIRATRPQDDGDRARCASGCAGARVRVPARRSCSRRRRARCCAAASPRRAKTSSALAPPVLRHRLLLSFAAEAEQRSPDDIIAFLLRSVPYPA